MEPVLHPSPAAEPAAPAPPRTLGFSWPLLVALATSATVLVLAPAARVLGDADTYWHLAAGRWILAHGRVPAADPFSHTMPGAPWTAHEWLSEVLLYAVHAQAGWAALVALTAAALALALALLMQFLQRRMEPVHALLLVGLAAALALPHALARPHVLAWPLLVAWGAALVEAGESRRGPPWKLLGVMLLWANLHGSFTFGLALGAALALEAVLAQPAPQRRAAALRWAGFMALACVAALLTPSGLDGLLFTLHVMQLQVALAHIGEWLSPDFHQPQPLELWLLLLLGLALSGRARLPLLRLLLVLGLLHLALKHQRNTAVLGLVSPLLLAAPLAQQWRASAAGAADAQALDRWFRALAAPSRWGARLAALGLAAWLALAVLPARQPVPAALVSPQAAVDAALRAGVRGPVLNGYGFGGYLIHRGIPVFIDGRADMYGDAFLQTLLEAINLKERGTLTALLERHGIGWTLLAPGTPAIAVLDTLPGWRRVHADDLAVVHMRTDGAQP